MLILSIVELVVCVVIFIIVAELFRRTRSDDQAPSLWHSSGTFHDYVDCGGDLVSGCGWKQDKR